MKPRIFFADGYWRVTWMPPKRQRTPVMYLLYSQAHEFAHYLNSKTNAC